MNIRELLLLAKAERDAAWLCALGEVRSADTSVRQQTFIVSSVRDVGDSWELLLSSEDTAQ